MPPLNTFIYWCDKCGKRFSCEPSEEALGEAGSIFCTACTAPKRAPRATGVTAAPGATSVRSRTAQVSLPPSRRSSERMRTPQRGAPLPRTVQPPPANKRPVRMIVGFVAAAAIALVVVLVFALGGSKPTTTARKETTRPTTPVTEPPVKVDTPVPVVAETPPPPVDTTPKTAIDAERAARIAFDELEAKLKQLPEGDRDARLTLCEAFLNDHGTTIMAARVRTLTGSLRGPVAQTTPKRGPNLALNKPVKTSVKHELDKVPERAVDGNTDREAAWFGNASPAWLEVDLQQIHCIGCVHVFLYPDDKRYYHDTLESSIAGKEYRQLSDMSANTATSTAQGVRHVFNPVLARYVRIHILKNSANPSVHVVELIVEPALAKPVGGGQAVAHRGVTDFEGGKFYPNFKNKGVAGRAIWGIRTDTHTMKTTLKVAEVPDGTLSLEIRSLRHEPSPPAAIRISLNGTVIHEGRDKNTEPQWRTSTYALPENLIQAGDNQLEIVCTEDSNVKNRPPWFMLNELKLLAQSSPPRVPDVHLSDLKLLKSECGHTGVQLDKSCLQPQPLRLHGVEYAKGVGVHAHSELLYDLTPEYKRFVARFGFQDREGQLGKGSVVGRVLIDGAVMQETTLFRGGDPDRDFDFPIPPGSKQIALIVSDGGDGEGWDLVNWVNAGFVRE